MEKIMIELKQISKSYKIYNHINDRLKEAFNIFGKQYSTDFYALNGINFTVYKGETLGIIGLNGAGKSTLLKIISGVLNPSSGTCEVNGKVTSLLELGAGFDPEYTGYENIYLYGSIYGYTREDMNAKLDDIVKFADIGDFVNQPVKNYSSGMFARLAFAVIAHLEPDILIVDEALSVGDIFFQQKCNIFMKEKMKDATKIIVTHDMNSIATMCDRVIVLNKGQIVFNGEASEAIEYYLKYAQNKVFKEEQDEQEELENTRRQIEENNASYQLIGLDKLSGSQDAVMTHCAIYRDGKPFNGVVRVGETIEVRLKIHAKKDISHAIFGYLIKDKYGNAIFGQNTAENNVGYEMKANHLYEEKLSFIWPEIAKGDYFLTPGIGAGNDESTHQIVCWAHNIAHFQNINDNFVHAMFNNEITNFELDDYKEE